MERRRRCVEDRRVRRGGIKKEGRREKKSERDKTDGKLRKGTGERKGK